MGFSTDAVHGRKKKWKVSDKTNAINTPIYETAAFSINSPEEAAEILKRAGETFSKGEEDYIYSRGGNPTSRELDHVLKLLEGGEDAITFGTGMAAITALAFSVLEKGDHVVCTNAVFGDTHHLFGTFMKKYGVECDFVDTTDLEKTKQVIKENTKLIFVETPTNPTLNITDIEALSKIKGNALLVVDNTFATPYLQQPIKLGADAVADSLTKGINGHCDALGGVVVGSKELIAKIRLIFFMTGAVLDPFSAFLIRRGIQTLDIRMEKTCQSTLKVVDFLKDHPKIEKLYFPGLETHPQYEICKKQMKYPGALVAFELKGGFEAGKKLLKAVKLCTFAVSLGATHTLIQHPASMTHAIISKEEREKSGIAEGLVRIAIGLEDVEDIIADLKQALEQV